MGLTHQEPVDVHDREEQQQCVEEEIVWDVGHRPQAAVAGDVQNLKREPVEAEPEPEGRGQSSRLGRRKGRHSLPWLSLIYWNPLALAFPFPPPLCGQPHPFPA